MNYLQAAQEWGIPPWELTGEDTEWERFKWLERWRVLRGALAARHPH